MEAWEVCPLPQNPTIFFEGLELANTEYGTSILFKNINLQHFAILSDNNIIIFADRYAIFKNYDSI